MDQISLKDAKNKLEALEAQCAKLKKCQRLPEEELRGKYRVAYEREQERCRALFVDCMRQVAPWGLQVAQRNADSALDYLLTLRETPEYRKAVEDAVDWIRRGDWQAMYGFIDWLRGHYRLIARLGGQVDTRGDVIFE